MKVFSVATATILALDDQQALDYYLEHFGDHNSEFVTLENVSELSLEEQKQIEVYDRNEEVAVPLLTYLQGIDTLGIIAIEEE